MRHVRIILALLCSLPLLRASVPSAIAIKDAHVVTVSGDDLPKATVILRNGLIEEVGASVPVPADAWVIDGAGLTVYPGFIDGLSTWGIPVAPASANAAPPTQARVHGPEDRPQTYSFERAADLVSPADTRLDAAKAAGFTSAATFPSRGIFTGLGAMVDLTGERGRNMVVAQPIGQEIAIRTGAGGFSRTFPGSLMGNISYVRQLFLDVDEYQQAKKIYAAYPVGTPRPEYDHALEGLAESPRILLPAVQTQQINRMLLFGAELKRPFILYGLHEAYRSMDELKQAKVPLLVSLKWPEKPRDADPADVPSDRDLVLREQAPAVPGMLAKAGLKFGFYSDGIASAGDLKKALKKAVDAGLSRADAVRALTLNVAEMYGVEDRMGSIAKGKIANLVVVKGEVFDDKSTIEYLFIDGQQFRPSRELQQGLPTGPAGGRGTAPALDTDDQGDHN
jgi:hypothetical protein